MAVELATAYISIVPETSKIAPDVRKALTGVEKDADRTGGGWGTKLGSAMGKTLKTSAIGAGVAAGGVLGASLTKGLGRLNAIEQAEAKLTGLGNSAGDVAKIMDNANAAVKGTAYGLDEAATTAAMAVAAGIKPGQELEQVLKTTADTAGIAGASMSEMGTIFGSVAARGKLQGDDLMQLQSRGIPVLQLLAAELDTTAEAVSEMVSEGEIDFATFERAMRAGVGGAAAEAGKTVSGAMANMGAALGRVGATAAGPFFNRAAGAFTGVTEAIDGMNARLKPVMADIDAWLGNTAVPALQRFGTAAAEAFDSIKNSGEVQQAIQGTVDAARSLGEAFVAVAPPVARIVAEFSRAAGALGVSTWQVFVTTLEAAGAVIESLAGPLTTVADFMSAHPGMVTAAVAAWAGFKTVPGIIGQITSKMQPHVTSLKTMGTGVRDLQKYYASTGQQIDRFSATMRYAATSSNQALSAMGRGYTNASASLTRVSNAHRQAAAAAKANALASTNAFESIDFMAQQAGHSFVASTAKMGAAAKGFAGAGLGTLKAGLGKTKAGISTLINMLGGPWGIAFAGATAAVSSMVSGFDAAKSTLEEQRKLADGTKQAYTDMFTAIVEGSSQLDAATASVERMQESIQNIAANDPGWFHRGLMGLEETIGVETEYTRQATAIRDAADTAKEAQQVLADLGLTNQDLARAAAGSASEFASMREKLQTAGRGGEFVAAQMVQMRDGILKAREATEKLGPAGVAAAAALKDIADKAGTAGERANKLQRAFMELAGVSLTAAEANAQLTGVIDSVSADMEGLAGATLAASGAFDTTTTAGAEAHEAIMSIGDAMRDAVAAGEPAAAVFARSEASLKQLSATTNMTEAEYQQMLATYGLTPEKLETVVALSTDSATAELGAIQAQFSEFAGTPMTKTVNVSSQEAVDKLNALGIKITEFDQKTGTATATVRDDEALTKLNDLIYSKIPQLDQQVARPKAELNADALFATKEFAAAQLATLDLARPFPWADLDISSLDAKQIDALQKVGLLDGQTPTPQASLDINQLTAEQQTALAQIFDLDSQRPTPLANLTKEQLDAKANDAMARLKKLHETKTEPKVSANTSAAINALGGVRDMLSSLKDKTINIFTRRHDSGGDGKATGGIAGYATGGRLPVSGPGTHVTDGILGVDGKGMPTARVDAGEWVINAKQSQKYDALLAAINRDDPRVDAMVGGLDALAGGGKVQGRAVVTSEQLDNFAQGLEGQPYVWAGVNWGDCSGAMSAIANYATGRDPFGSRFATGNMREELLARGFQLGRGAAGDLRFGWFNGGPAGGHTSGTLPNGVNVEMGGGRGNGQYGGSAAGADHSQYTDHAYLAVDKPTPVADTAEETTVEYHDSGDSSEPEFSTSSNYLPSDDVADPNMVPVTGADASVAETVTSAQGTDNPLLTESSISGMSGSVVQKMVSGQVSDLLDVFGIKDELPPIIQAGQQFLVALRDSEGVLSPAEALKRLRGAAAAITSGTTGETADTEGAAVDSGGGSASISGDTVSSPSPDDAQAIVQDTVADRGWGRGGQWNALDWLIDKQSGWDASASITGSSRFGLFQLKASTGVHPATADAAEVADQAAAGADYIEARYGDPVAAQEFWKANRWYDSGGVARGVGHMLKNTIKPERVLSPQQTKAFNDLVYKKLPAMETQKTQQPAQPGQATPGQDVPVSPEQPPVPVMPETPDASGAAVATQGANTADAVAQTDGSAITQQVSGMVGDITGQVSAFMSGKKVSQIAGEVVSTAVRTAGNTATSVAASGVSAAGDLASQMLPAAASVASGLGGVAGPVGSLGGVGQAAAAPLSAVISPATALASTGVSTVGGIATDMAANYAGQVTTGVVGAFEEYATEMVGATPAGMLRDAFGAFMPVVEQAKPLVDALPEAVTQGLGQAMAPVATQATGGGDVYNFNATNPAAAMSMFRREVAKQQKGLVGAR